MFVGGLSGDNIEGASITNSYSLGHVAGGQDVGGLLGYNEGEVESAYWDLDTSGQANSAGGLAENDSAMQNQGTYSDWDFNTVWVMNHYPALRH